MLIIIITHYDKVALLNHYDYHESDTKRVIEYVE